MDWQMALGTVMSIITIVIVGSFLVHQETGSKRAAQVLIGTATAVVPPLTLFVIVGTLVSCMA